MSHARQAAHDDTIRADLYAHADLCCLDDAVLSDEYAIGDPDGVERELPAGEPHEFHPRPCSPLVHLPGRAYDGPLANVAVSSHGDHDMLAGSRPAQVAAEDCA